MLIKWDESRGIKRDIFYHNLPLIKKKELLTQLAWLNFEKKRYFFEKREVEQFIADYLRSLPNNSQENGLKGLIRNAFKNFKDESEAVLKSIEVQHGLLVERAREIYSFSHLTFQEYFTAKAVINRFDPQNLETFSLITRKSWREVFLLAVEMIHSADQLLLPMKHKIDALVASDEKIQKFLIWLFQKSRSVQTDSKPAQVRAFYFDLACAFAIDYFNQSKLKFSSIMNFGFHLYNELKFDNKLVDLMTEIDGLIKEKKVCYKYHF